MATNIGKASAALAIGGVEYEQALGMMTAITEIQRSGAKAARGLVSIQSRYNQILDETSSTGQKLIAFYDEHNIQLYDQEGQLRSLWETLSDVAEIWDTLDENEQKYFLNIQAGANQSVQLGALMGNFQTAIEATETALNSVGSAMQENESYMQSLNARTHLLQATFQTLANDVIPKELIAKGLEALDKVLKILDTDLGIILTRITMLTGIGWGLSGLVNASKILPTIINQFSNFVKLFSGASIVISETAAATGGLTAAMATFQSVALPIIAILTALGVGIYTLWERAKDTVSPIDKLTGSLQELNNSIENTNTNFEKSVGEIEATSTVAEQYIQRLEELEKQSSLTTEEQIEYNSILQNLESLIPSVSGLIDKQTGSIIGGTNALREQIQAWKDLAIQQAYQERLTDVYKNYANAQIEYEQRKLESEGIERRRNEVESSLTQAVSKRNQLLTALGTTTNKAEREYIGSQIGYYEGIIKEQQKLYESLGVEKVPYSQALDQFEAGLKSAKEEIDKTEEVITKLIAEMGSSAPSSTSSSSISDLINQGISPETIVSGMFKSGMAPHEVVAALLKSGMSVEEISKLLKIDLPQEEGEKEEQFNYTNFTKKISKNLIKNTKKLKFSIQKYISESESYIDLLKSEYDLMNLQGKSEDELISKAKQLQGEYHKEAEILRKVLENSENLKLSDEEIYDIETNINKLSAEWWNWQNKINALLEKAKKSTEGIKEDVEDVYDKYMKAVEAERQEERERKLKERKEWDTYKYWLEQAYKINSYVEQLKASNEELKKQLELEEKLDKLARAKESRVLVYRNGNYEYIQDVDQVSKAAKDLSTYQEEESLEKKINGLLELASAYQTMAEELASGKLGHSSIVAETIKAVEEQGGWRKVFGAYPEETPKTVEEIEINTREIVNNLALIGKKIKVFPYAGGTTRASGGLSLVGEKGAELRVLNRGDGILPADLTSNLMRWGQFSPNEFKSNSITGFGSNMSVTIQALNLPNVSDGAGFVEYVRTHMFGQVLNLVH